MASSLPSQDLPVDGPGTPPIVLLRGISKYFPGVIANADVDLEVRRGEIHALLGEREQALAWLRRAVEVGNHNYPWFQKDKNYDSLRGDPEYQRIMEEVRRHWEQYKRAFGES